MFWRDIGSEASTSSCLPLRNRSASLGKRHTRPRRAHQSPVVASAFELYIESCELRRRVTNVHVHV